MSGERFVSRAGGFRLRHDFTEPRYSGVAVSMATRGPGGEVLAGSRRSRAAASPGAERAERPEPSAPPSFSTGAHDCLPPPSLPRPFGQTEGPFGGRGSPKVSSLNHDEGHGERRERHVLPKPDLPSSQHNHRQIASRYIITLYFICFHESLRASAFNALCSHCFIAGLLSFLFIFDIVLFPVE